METIVEVAWEIHLWTEGNDSLLKCNPYYRKIQKSPIKKKNHKSLDTGQTIQQNPLACFYIYDKQLHSKARQKLWLHDDRLNTPVWPF